MSLVSSVSFTLNGKEHLNVPVSNPAELLLDYLQSTGVDLCGTKYGCGEGGCGACSLLIKSHEKDEFRVINSCLRPLAACDGLQIMSVEGLPKDISRPLPTSSQKAGSDGLTSGLVNEVAYAIAESGGTQCGFCTPGFTMTLYEAQQRHLEKACASKCGDHSKSCKTDPLHCDHKILTDIEDLYSGHICRCTGYRGLRLAAKRILLPENEEVKKELIEVPPYAIDVEGKSYTHKTLENPNVELVNLKADNPQKPQAVPEPSPPSKKPLKMVAMSSKPSAATTSAPTALQFTSEVIPDEVVDVDVLSEIRGGTGRHWYSAKSLQDVKSIVNYAVEAGLKYKLVYGNTSAGIYKSAEWTDIDLFVNMNTLPEYNGSQPIIINGSLLIPSSCTINSLKRFLLQEEVQRTVETEAILTLVERVAGNQVRNAGTVGGSVAMAVRRLFLSDTFLSLAISGAVANLHHKVAASWEHVTAPLLSVLALKDENFILESFSVPLNPVSIVTSPIIRCYKVSRRLQNSHSLINLACRVTTDKACQFIVGNIADHYLELKYTAAAVSTTLALSFPHKVDNASLLSKIEDLLFVCKGELQQNVVSNAEFDEEEPRVTLALNLMRRFLLDLFGTIFKTVLVQDQESVVHNVYKDKMNPQNDSHGVQGFRVNIAEFPVSEPMIKTTAVQQAEGETKYTRTLTLPENCLHATFVLSAFSTGQLIWNQERLAGLSQNLAAVLLKDLAVVVAPEEIKFYRAVDVGPGNCLTTSAYQNYREYLLADQEVVYYGQAIAIIATPLQAATEYLAKLLFEHQVREEASTSDVDPLCVVAYRKTYTPFLTLDDLDTPVPILDVKGVTTFEPRLFNSVVDKEKGIFAALNYISNLDPLPDPNDPKNKVIANKVINFDKYRNDEHVVVSGTHEVGSQYHFAMETQNAWAHAPIVNAGLLLTSASTIAQSNTNVISRGAVLDELTTHPISRMVSVASMNRPSEKRTYAERLATSASTSDPVPVPPPVAIKKTMHIMASTQSTVSVSQNCSTLLGGIHGYDKTKELYQVHTHVENVGGGFGSKEPQSRYVALAAAFVADNMNRPCRVALDRNTDMLMIGKRHPMRATYTLAAEKATGKIVAMYIHYTMDAGVSYDASLPIMDLAVLSSFNGYDIKEFVCEGDTYFTNKATNTAMRSFGVIQANQLAEAAVELVTTELIRANPALNPFTIRKTNFFEWHPIDTPDSELPQAPYGQPLRSCNLDGVWASMSRRMLQRKYSEVADGVEKNERVIREVLNNGANQDAGFKYMQDKVASFNSQHEYVKQGLSVLPLMYGISFTYIPMNAMRAVIEICPKSGIVYVQSFGVEVGQGLHTKLLQIASLVLGVKPHLIRMNTLPPSATEKLPDGEDPDHKRSYPGTGASTGTDLNGRAIQALMTEDGSLMKLLVLNPALHAWFLSETPGVKMRNTWYDNNGVDKWPEAVKHFKSYNKKLQFTGEYDMTNLLTQIGTSIQKGAPFYYFNYAAAMSHVQLDCLTGEWSILATDIVYDAGVSINPMIDLGQIEGGFVQGTGFVTTEEIKYLTGKEGIGAIPGQLITEGTWTYKPPTTTEIPQDFNVYLYPCDEYDIALLSGNARECLEDEWMILNDKLAAGGGDSTKSRSGGSTKSTTKSVSKNAHSSETDELDAKKRRIIHAVKNWKNLAQKSQKDFCAHKIKTRQYSIDDLVDSFGTQSSKTTGEPPLVLANTVYFALKDAVGCFQRETNKSTAPVELKCPATTYNLVSALKKSDK